MAWRGTRRRGRPTVAAAWTILLMAGCGGGSTPPEPIVVDGSTDGTVDPRDGQSDAASDAAADARPDAPSCDGCWDATGRCQSGEQDSACGVGGGSCLRCAEGERCRAGVCVAAPPCAERCGGCCAADGACLAGNSPAACGQGGATCEACPMGVPCVDGVCDPAGAPCASTCRGCCTESGECIDPPTDMACGSAGARCVACASASSCVEGSCQFDMASRWDVTALEASVPRMDPDGEDWDPGWGAVRRPDVAVRASVFVDGVAVEGEVGPADDTFTPAWNEVVLRNLPASALLGRDGIGFALRDVDPLNPDDPVGSCVYVPTPEDFDARRIETPCGDGVTLVFRIEPH